MIAYKAFDLGLICRGYQFNMGINTTSRANCRSNGFHCAENPLDCLTYYRNIKSSEFYLVKAEGDIDEDGNDTKIACTKLIIEKKLTFTELLLHGLAFMIDHPKREWSLHVHKDHATAQNGYAIVRGLDPLAKGKMGDILALAKEVLAGEIMQVALLQVDGIKVLPNCWYNADLTERQVACFE